MANETNARSSIASILSLAACIAWLTIAYSGDCIVLPRVSAFETTSTFLVAATLGMGTSLTLCALLPKLGWQTVTSKAGLLASSVLCGATTFLLGFESLYPHALFLADSFAAGFFYGIVLIRCSLLRLDADSRAAATGVCLATIIGALMYALSTLIAETHSNLWVLAITALLPVCSAASGLLDTSDNLPLHDNANDALAPAFWRVMAFIGVLSFFLSFVRGFYPHLIGATAFASSRADAAFMITITMAFIGLVLATRSRHSAFERIYYILFLVAAVLVLPLVAMGPQFALSGSLATLAKAILYLAMWCFLELWAFKTGMSPVRVFGFGAGSAMLGSFLGYLLGNSLSRFVDASSGSVFCLALALVCLVVALLLLRRRELEGFMVPTAAMVASVEEESEPRTPQGNCATCARALAGANLTIASADAAAAATTTDLAEEPGEEGASAVEAESEFARTVAAATVRKSGRFKARCYLVADEYGLTSREKEVLVLLAKHTPIQAIADELIVSFNTARTHTRHIYAKLNVHNRQELVELVDAYEVEK